MKLKKYAFHSAVVGAGIVAASTVFVGCGKSNNTSDGSGSDVATSVVSGSMNNTGGGTVGFNSLPMKTHESRLAMLLDELNPVRPAYAELFGSCTGGTGLSGFTGDGTYTYIPLSCSVTWGNGRTASSTWTGTGFQLVYSGTCDSVHKLIWNQPGACTVTRTTDTNGETRTISGPLGNSYAIKHDTNGSGSGWDPTVSPAPTNSGVAVACGTDGCATDSGSHTLAITGSHLTGTLDGKTFWDHTITGNLSVTGQGTGRTVNGAITVQHNLAKFTATATFSDVVYGEAGCCFPTAGSVATTVNGGGSETLTFSTTCGEATLTQPNGTTSAYTLQHCL